MTLLSNPRHERFAQELAKGETADAAYVNAGFKPSRGNASRLKANDIISARVFEIQGMAADKVVVTIDDIARQLDEDRAFAMKVGSAAAAVASTMGKAKVLGLIIDKAEVKTQGTVTVLRVSRDEAEAARLQRDEEDYST